MLRKESTSNDTWEKSEYQTNHEKQSKTLHQYLMKKDPQKTFNKTRKRVKSVHNTWKIEYKHITINIWEKTNTFQQQTRKKVKQSYNTRKK